MITFDQAKEIARNSIEILPTENVPFESALYRVLAENVKAKEFFPAFNKSAMDGYACRIADIGEIMEVIEIIPAGKNPSQKIGKNQCAKIMTGAMIPDGADTVIIKENAEVIDKNHIICSEVFRNTNICYKGEDAEEGEILLLKGTRLENRHLSVLAALGHHSPLVYVQPKIGILVTGSELVEPTEKPNKTQIRNSNAYSILTLLKQYRFPSSYFGIVADDLKLMKQSIINALKNNDVLIMSGAISVGDYDFVPQILKEIGFEILFHGLQMKPGKRLLFAKKDKKWVIGLPGNPVSTFVQMHEFALAFLYELMGNKFEKPTIFLPVEIEISRKKGDKLEIIPVKLTHSGKIMSVAYNGSGHLNALVAADGLMEFPIGKTLFKPNDLARFIPF